MPRASGIVTNDGNSSESLPRPYETQAPIEGNPKISKTGVGLISRWRVIRVVSHTRADDRQLICHLGEFGEQIRDPEATLPTLFEPGNAVGAKDQRFR